MYNKLINYGLVFFILMVSISFMDVTFLNEQIIKVFEIIGIGLIIFFNIIYVIYDSSKKERHTFTKYIYLLLFSSIICLFAAYAFHNQSFKLTLFQQRCLFLYLFYFTLHNLNIAPKYLEKLLFGTGIFIAVIYLIQYFVYPLQITSAPMALDRGTLRIYIPGRIFHEVALLYSFSMLLYRYQTKYLITFIFLFGVFILYGSRGIIICRKKWRFP